MNEFLHQIRYRNIQTRLKIHSSERKIAEKIPKKQRKMCDFITTNVVDFLWYAKAVKQIVLGFQPDFSRGLGIPRFSI